MKNKSSNLVTVLTANVSQHKTLSLNEDDEYVILDKPFSKFFLFEEVAISDINDLHDLILKNQYIKNNCFIRGKMTEFAYEQQLSGYKVRRVINEKIEENYVYKQTIEDCPKQWIMLDIDNFPTPEGSNLYIKEGREEAVEKFVATLHESFKNVSYVCQFSNGMFLNSKKIKAHIWFMLSEAYSCKTLKPWFEKYCEGVDTCVFRPAQILYTANPRFINSIDPLKNERIYLKEKSFKSVNLPKKQIINSYLNYTQ